MANSLLVSGTFQGRITPGRPVCPQSRYLFPAGTFVLANTLAANRDPAIYNDADRFDITRKHVPHVAFGGGSHICIGAPLARIEARRALVKLFERFPDLHLAGDEPTWRALPFFRGMEALSVQG